jgi:hypothetical protein
VSLLCVRVDLFSNPDTRSAPDSYCGLPQTLEVNARIITQLLGQ